MKRIAIVAAEPSGDQLASHLMAALKNLDNAIQFEGIGGPKMISQGMKSWYPMESLSVMGIIEVIKHLPELLGIRKNLVKRWQADPPALFIGVDAPDFNLGLETKLRSFGIPTVQYVSPTVWAWRQGRVNTLRKGVDLVLSIFPFEVPLLAKHKVNAFYAGHPLAQDLKEIPDQNQLRSSYQISIDQPVLGLLPGSRMSEVVQLTDDFLQAASKLSDELNGLKIVVPAATPKIKHYFLQRAASYSQLDMLVLDGNSRDVMAMADVVLLASGTASFETMLYKKPMVVAYKVHWLTYFIGFTLGLVKTEFIAMPNILAGKALVPEFFQDKCQSENLYQAMLSFFTDNKKRQDLKLQFEKMHQELSQGDIEDAARKILELI